MRYASESFKEIQDEVVRPPLKLWFEVGTDITHTITGVPNELDFDTTVAPIVAPKNCVNEHYYAVIGDSKPVDDPNRICAPENGGGVDDPITTVPYGITPVATGGNEVLIGDSAEFYNNFAGFASPVKLSFKGVVPDQVRVERYDLDTSTWVTEDTISNTLLEEEVFFLPADYDQAGNFRRFWVKRSGARCRFQLNYIKACYALRAPQHPTILFQNDYVASVNIDQETDLTSQTLPSYEMTVTCLDVNEEFTPDTDFWKYQFADGSPCYLRIGYEVGEGIEYLPFMYGKLNQPPTYGEGKITFKASVEWRTEWDISLTSIPDDWESPDNIAKSALFKDIIADNGLFDTYDVFHGDDDEYGSECNYYGVVDSKDARQLVANALGCYITAGINAFDLHNSNDVQYISPVDVLTRYEQVTNTLESRSKVGKILITRNENLQASGADRYESIAPIAPVAIPAGETEVVNFTLPFYPISRIKLAGAGIFEVEGGIVETINSDGTVNVALNVTNTSAAAETYSSPAEFFKVTNNQYKETDETEEVLGEVYENNNELITNGYTAGKANRVAHLINDVNSQYEVDVIQNYCYELGDVVRLETQKNKFITCVITGLQYSMPGSSGRVTCRKIFSLDDTPYSVKGAQGLKITFGLNELTILEADEDYCVVAHYSVPAQYTGVVLVLGATSWEETHEGVPVVNPLGLLVTDNNEHIWSIAVVVAGDEDIPVTTAPVIELPLDPEGDLSYYKYAAIELIKMVYEAQGMTAPVTWDSEVHWNWE